jgi:hypothetical protein
VTWPDPEPPVGAEPDCRPEPDEDELPVPDAPVPEEPVPDDAELDDPEPVEPDEAAEEPCWADWACAAPGRVSAMPPPARTLAATMAAVAPRSLLRPRSRSAIAAWMAARSGCRGAGLVGTGWPPFTLARAGPDPARWCQPARRVSGRSLVWLRDGCERWCSAAAVDSSVDGSVERRGRQGINARCPVDDKRILEMVPERPCVLGVLGSRTTSPRKTWPSGGNSGRRRGPAELATGYRKRHLSGGEVETRRRGTRPVAARGAGQPGNWRARTERARRGPSISYMEGPRSLLRGDRARRTVRRAVLARQVFPVPDRRQTSRVTNRIRAIQSGQYGQ